MASCDQKSMCKATAHCTTAHYRVHRETENVPGMTAVSHLKWGFSAIPLSKGDGKNATVTYFCINGLGYKYKRKCPWIKASTRKCASTDVV